MKILVVQDHLRSGGTERQTLQLVNGWAAAGHTTTLLTFRPGGALASTCAPEVRRQVFQPFDTRLDWWAPGLHRTVRRANPQVVMCMGRMANCYAGGLQRSLPGAAVLATLRTGKPLPHLFRRSLRQVRHVVANSEEARQQALRLEQLSPDRVTVIHNALVFSGGTPDDSARARVRLQLGATDQTLVLINVAMFRPEKNQRALLEIVQGLPQTLDWQLWLAGDGPTRRACEEEVQQRGLSERVRFLGWSADPSPLYAAADLAVLTSRRESLSNFLIESQAAGLPALAYNALGVAETFRPELSGVLVPMDDVDTFRSGLLSLHRDPLRRAAMADAARAHARTHFSPQRQLQAYLDLFEHLLAT